MDEYPITVTITFKDGRWDNGLDGGLSGPYSVDADQLRIDVPDFGYPLLFTFEADDRGSLHLTPVRPMDAGDAFIWASKPWEKIEGPTSPPTQVNGTYRWTLTADDVLASQTEEKSTAHLATFPWVFTMTLQDGTWTLTHTEAGQSLTDASADSYVLAGDQITFEWNEGGGPADKLRFTFAVDSEGGLRLQPIEPMNTGDVFVWTTHSWTRID